MALADFFAKIEPGRDLEPLIQALLVELEAMLDTLQPTKIDRNRSAIVPGIEGLSIDIVHRDAPELTVGVESFGEEVVVNYGEEHEHFDVEHEFVSFAVEPLATEPMVSRVVAFLRSLMSGRVELHVSHRLFYVKTRSYWINDAGERELFLRGGTVIPTLRWTREPVVKTFDFTDG